jgi:hypothetical protein
MKKLLVSSSLFIGACCLTALFWTHPAFLKVFPPINPANDLPKGAMARGLTESQEPQAKRGEKSAPAVIGYSSRNNPINAFTFGSGEMHILVFGGTHGDEPTSVAVVEAFVASLKQEPVPQNISITIVPRVNPDGLTAGTRTNSNGVDINRNFPSNSWVAEAPKSRYFPGKKAASEPETRALMSVIEKSNPILIISIHAPLDCINWDGPADEVARLMSEASGYPLQPYIGYKTPGSLGSFAGTDRKIPTVTLELPDGAAIGDLVRDGGAALRTALMQVSSAPRATPEARLDVNPDVVSLLSKLMEDSGGGSDKEERYTYVYFDLGGDAYVFHAKTRKFVTKLTQGEHRKWRCKNFAEVFSSVMDNDMNDISQGSMTLMKFDGKAWHLVARAEGEYQKKTLIEEKVPQVILDCLGIEGY